MLGMRNTLKKMCSENDNVKKWISCNKQKDRTEVARLPSLRIKCGITN